jgi:hypothetical protein
MSSLPYGKRINVLGQFFVFLCLILLPFWARHFIERLFGPRGRRGPVRVTNVRAFGALPKSGHKQLTLELLIPPPCGLWLN